MYPHPDYRNAASGPSITEADGPANPSVASWVQLARDQTHFADQPSLTLEEFKRWPHFPEARQELFCSLHWLTTLLPGDGDESIVRKGITNLVRPLTDLERPKTNDLLALYGPVKQNLKLLCELLTVDPRPHAVAAACGELRLVFGTASGLHVLNELGIAIERAVEAVVHQAPQASRRGDAQAQASTSVAPSTRALLAGPSTSVVRPPRASANEPPPQSRDAVLAGLLPGLRAEGVRQLCTRLGTSFNRLMTLIPPDMDDLRHRLTAWRDRHATPPEVFHGHHAEMLEGGHLVLTALCDKLDELDRLMRRDVFACLAEKVPSERSFFNEVAGLFNVLVAAEEKHAGRNNPLLEERLGRIDEWAASQLLTGKVTQAQVDDAAVVLGLDDPDVDIDGERSRMHPVRNNAAWRLCLGLPLDPVDVPPLADVRNADLIAARVGSASRT